jgi:hypothetical protein
MRSFAVWYNTPSEIKNASEKVENINLNNGKEISIHVNLWTKIENEAKKYCFDIGLLIEDLQGIENIYVYMPFDKHKVNVKDLGSIISKNNRLVNAIFNENFTTTSGQAKRLIVNGTGEKASFIIYSLEVNRQIDYINIKKSNGNTGTILKIKSCDIDSRVESISRYYFRLRLEVEEKEVSLINNEVGGINIFSNAFTKTEVIDFRLNDIRSCSDELREEIAKGKTFNIKAVHYLILRKASDIIINYGKKINSRMLEKDLWKDYIEESKHDIIAYHIKAKAKKKTNSRIGYYVETKAKKRVDINTSYYFKAEIKKRINNKDREELEYIQDFSDLTRFQYEKERNWIVVLVYIFTTVFIGALGSILGNFFQGYIK